MHYPFPKMIGAIATTALLGLAAPALAQSHDHDAAHSHDHGSDDIYNGYFDDSQIEARALTDWAGAWQSVYPLLQDGTLAPVMAHKAETGDMTAAEYTAYYSTGYATEVDRIEIENGRVTFHSPDTTVQGTYADDGHEVLTYAKGNRGVRYIFRKSGGDAGAPEFIQFSDHRIAPAASDHYHLYWGDDRAALLEDVTNWPTYYPAGLGGEAIAHEMMAH